MRKYRKRLKLVDVVNTENGEYIRVDKVKRSKYISIRRLVDSKKIDPGDLIYLHGYYIRKESLAKYSYWFRN